MAALTFTPFFYFGFVCVLVSVSADQNIVTAESGQNVTLTCRAPNSNIPIRVAEWSRADLEPEYVLFYRDKKLIPDNQHPSFKNRVDLQDRQMKDGDVSLILKDVTTADEGTYECCVVLGLGEPMRSISTISLRVVGPPGPRGTTENGGKDGAVGLIIGLSVCTVFFAVVGALIYRTKSNSSRSHL